MAFMKGDAKMEPLRTARPTGRPTFSKPVSLLSAINYMLKSPKQQDNLL